MKCSLDNTSCFKSDINWTNFFLNTTTLECIYTKVKRHSILIVLKLKSKSNSTSYLPPQFKFNSERCTMASREEPQLNMASAIQSRQMKSNWLRSWKSDPVEEKSSFRILISWCDWHLTTQKTKHKGFHQALWKHSNCYRQVGSLWVKMSWTLLSSPGMQP